MLKGVKGMTCIPLYPPLKGRTCIPLLKGRTRIPPN